MDIGGFRDMHRHRKCVQLLQGYTDLHGYDELVCSGQPTLAEAGLEAGHKAPSGCAHLVVYRLCCVTQTYLRPHESAQYVPVARNASAGRCSKWTSPRRCTSPELRSGVAGHFSYCRVALGDVQGGRGRGILRPHVHFRIE